MILDEELLVKRRKITEIYERRFFNRRERNEFGEWEYVEKELWYKRPMEVVSSGTRLIHFILDYGVLSFVFGVVSGFFVGVLPPVLINNLLPLIFFLTHFILGEYYCQKTFAKFITGAIVVNEYGETPDVRTIIIRSLVRFVPFEPFSFWGNIGWHDRWTKTFVIRRSELEKLRALIREADDVDSNVRFQFASKM
jgi:uncharacterized RDD family membrane protein YckC